MTVLDPRWDWHEVTDWSGQFHEFVRGPCLHIETAPVEAGDEVVAWLCLTCDLQLPEEWHA